MDASGVLSSCVTALIKASCCSLRRISRMRKVVFRTRPTIISTKKTMPKTSIATSRQLRMIQPTLSAVASATRHAPKVMKKAIDLRRPLTGIGRLYQSEALMEDGARGRQRRFTISHFPFLIFHFRNYGRLLFRLGKGLFFGLKKGVLFINDKGVLF